MGFNSSILLFYLFLSLFRASQASVGDVDQSSFFSLLKTSLTGNAMYRWDFGGPESYCNFTGIGCNERGYVEEFDISGWSLSGQFPGGICAHLPELRVLRLSRNRLSGNFIDSIVNCSMLEELNMSSVYLKATLPDFSRMNALRILDMSYNYFTGEFPISITNLTNLERLDFNENEELKLWKLPENVSGLARLRELNLGTCMLYGPIPASIGNMSSLVDLELSGNYLSGNIPPEIGQLKSLQQLELYYNYHLSGTIPEELGNLKELTDMDISVNSLTGSIPESICRLPKLRVLQAYNNSLTGEIPRAIENSTSLAILSLYDNFLTGELPKNLGKASALMALDVSENRLSGPLPRDLCKAGKLMYFLALQNMFSGEIPETYANCKTLIRFRLSSNRLEGPIPRGILGLPHVSIIDLAYNKFTGPIPNTSANSRNLSELFLQGNRISGSIPSEISQAINLVKIDFSGNQVSGPIPQEIGKLRKLNLLLLQCNMLNSSIPKSFTMLKSLNVLDLSNNQLTGSIPEGLSELLPTSINFSNNRLSGPIPVSLIKGGLVESFAANPGLCIPPHVDSSDKNFPICRQALNKNRMDSVWAIIISVLVLALGGILILRRKLGKNRDMTEHGESWASSFYSYDVKSFHRVNFDQKEILEAMIEKNIVGHGGSGTVYRIELRTGEIVAVKKLWSQKTKDAASEDRLHLDKELKTEVETLGSIRHKNIVKLFSYFSSVDRRLLVYEYMPNGNLWDALHKGWINLDWPTRHQIALGVAQGLAYLHHDLLPPIIHRDIKSTNILLDVNNQPKVADFGIAKVLQARGVKDSTTTVIAGTYGYLAPEYAYSSKATTRCDVYSFGVVLLELITGRKPVEGFFGENKNIVYWVSSKIDTKEGLAELLDERVSSSFSNEIIQVLRIAIRCTCKIPTARPTMNEVVQFLIDADPCKLACCRSIKGDQRMFGVTQDS